MRYAQPAPLEPVGLAMAHLLSGSSDLWSRRLLALGLRTRSPMVECALVELAYGAPLTPAQLEALLDRPGQPEEVIPPELLGPDQIIFTRSLAMLWSTSSDTLTQSRALCLFQGILGRRGPKVLGPTRQRVCSQLAVLLGRHELAREFLDTFHALEPAVRWGIEADLINPYTEAVGPHPAPAPGHEAWEAALSAPFERAGLAGVRVDPGVSAAVFDGLSAVPGASVDGPLVSIIVSAFEPDEGLFTSLRSLCDQSYGNLEILILDDCSPPEYTGFLERAAALDERIRVLRQPENGGTYLARNAGFAAARGEFLTTQDSDDWSHPERIARQVALLREDAAVPACLSGAIRAKPDLTHQWLGYSPQRMNASSLMLPRDTYARLGAFHPVRKGADSEYHARIGALLGPVEEIDQPLAVTRLRGGSLSRSDFSYGWHHPDRVFYRTAFMHWHETGAAADLPLDADPGADPAFATPRAFRIGLPGVPAPPPALDVVYLVDASRDHPLTRSRPGQPDLLAPERVGVLHLEDARGVRSRRPTHSPQSQRLGEDPRITLLSFADPVATPTLVVLEPGCLEVALGVPVEVRPQRVLVAAPPPDRDVRAYDLGEIAATVRHCFALDPTWVALTPRDRDVWAGVGWPLPLVADLLGTAGAEPPGSTSPALTLGARG